MAEVKPQKVQTPTGDLKYCFITGKGRLKPRSKDDYAYSCAIILEKKEGKQFHKEIVDYFNENKPAKCKLDEPENNIMTKLEDGRMMFQFRTNAEFEGKPTVVKIVNKHNEPRELPEGITIGDGSRGQILGSLKVYTGDTPSDAGCSMFLNAIKIGKFVPYEGGANFEGDMEDEDADFENFDMADFPTEKEEKKPKKSKKTDDEDEDEDEKPAKVKKDKKKKKKKSED